MPILPCYPSATLQIAGKPLINMMGFRTFRGNLSTWPFLKELKCLERTAYVFQTSSFIIGIMSLKFEVRFVNGIRGPHAQCFRRA